MPGSKHIYLGLYESEDEAARVCPALTHCRCVRLPVCVPAYPAALQLTSWHHSLCCEHACFWVETWAGG